MREECRATTAPGHCPWCGRLFDPGVALVQEFWTRDERWFSCWCQRCGRASEVGLVAVVVVNEQFAA